MTAPGAVSSGRELRDRPTDENVVQARLLVRSEGIQRVTYEQLRAAGADFGGIKLDSISLFNDGVVVPRFIQANGGFFGPGAAIEFVARPVLALASPVDVYTIEARAVKGNGAGTMSASTGVRQTVSATEERDVQSIYSFSSPNGDPWYEAGLLTLDGPASLSRSFDLPDLVSGPVLLELRTWGIGGWPGDTPDHHVRVELNGVEIADRRFDGPVADSVTIDVTSLVSASGNTLEIVAPDDTGYDFDYVAFDGFSVSYSRQSNALDGRFAATGLAPGNVSIGGFRPNDLVSVWRLSGSTAQRGMQVPAGDAIFAPGGGDLYAATGAALYSPQVVSGIPAPKAWSSAEYVIVTHPAFVDSLDALVALQQSKGLSTEVVTVDRIYAAYSDHAASPDAIRSFFAASYARGMRYALIAGADSSDPWDHLGIGSVSWVPTAYLQIGEVPFSPTDEALVDTNGDGLGEVPIGRFPARTPAELAAMIAKLLDWESQIASGRTAIFASGISDANAAFESLSSGFSGMLPGWSSTFASADELGSAGAKTELLNAINGGTKLVSYVGHSSISRWDWTPVLFWSDVAGLTNAGSPNLVTAWGCWNSYYVEPVYESLAAHLLRRSNAGAAGAIGATTLTSEASHQALGTLFFQQVSAGATRVGDAFRAAKQQLKAQGGADDAILGMTLLGDPAMSLPPAE
ncbi:MAG: C25 family cysteine peptidase [Thermoanaerobaculia bacterium]